MAQTDLHQLEATILTMDVGNAEYVVRKINQRAGRHNHRIGSKAEKRGPYVTKLLQNEGRRHFPMAAGTLNVGNPSRVLSTRQKRR